MYKCVHSLIILVGNVHVCSSGFVFLWIDESQVNFTSSQLHVIQIMTCNLKRCTQCKLLTTCSYKTYYKQLQMKTKSTIWFSSGLPYITYSVMTFKLNTLYNLWNGKVIFSSLNNHTQDVHLLCNILTVALFTLLHEFQWLCCCVNIHCKYCTVCTRHVQFWTTVCKKININDKAIFSSLN